MAISTWSPGTLYLPGSLVIPVSSGGAASTAIPNPSFAAGDSDWDKGVGWAINATSPFDDANSAEYVGPGVAKLVSSTEIAVEPGKSITCSCMIQQGASDDGQANGAVILEWYDSGSVLISTSTGNIVSTGAVGVWKQSTLTAVAPPLAAFVSIGITATNNWASLFADTFSWNYVTGTVASALTYKAVQAEAGLSGLDEPVWPTVVGNTVVDNEVTWEAVASGTVTWEASSVLTSGSSEPTWPTEAGAFVSDNNIAWETVPLRITDEHCPHTKVVAIAASKVFAGDSDIVRFCATLNARDWTTREDAGFLPTGLQQKSQVGVNAMGVYRGNLVVWSASTFQVWQVDPDPAAMALLDAMEGIGSIHQQAVQPVSDDLFFLAALGVRTVAIAAGSNNLATGDAGVPIDTLVQAEVTSDVEPIATYYPGAGQYWLAFRTLTMPILAIGAYLLTSTLYPIEYVEGFGSSGEYGKGTLLGFATTEAIDSGGSYLGGEFGEIVVLTSTQLEEIDVDGDYLGGELADKLIETTAPPEEIDSSASYLGGELAGKLVENDYDEAFDVSGSYLGGTLA